MEALFSDFTFKYLLMPVIAVIAAFLMIFIAKKNQLLGNKKAIFYFLLTWIILALPALLGFIDYWFMPYAYIGLTVLYFVLGVLNIKMLRIAIPEVADKEFHVEFLLNLVLLFIGGALFSLVFNLCNELQYGLWAATSMLPFLLPCVFRKGYITFLNIPLAVYKVWYYDKETDELDSDSIDYSKVLVVEMEIFKKPADDKAQNIKAKASEDLPFGIWYKIFLDDYNKRTPQSTIAFSEEGHSDGWIFYVTGSILGRKKHIDPDLTFAENKIREKNVIIAKRTKYEGYQ